MRENVSFECLVVDRVVAALVACEFGSYAVGQVTTDVVFQVAFVQGFIVAIVTLKCFYFLLLIGGL